MKKLMILIVLLTSGCQAITDKFQQDYRNRNYIICGYTAEDGNYVQYYCKR